MTTATHPVLEIDLSQDTKATRNALEEAARAAHLYVIDYRDFVLLKWAKNQMEIHRLQADSAELLEEMEAR